MAEQNAEGRGSFPLNLSALLVLLTLASGVWLVSQKLTSTRPAATAGQSHDVMDEQRVEARLWEDPFKPPGRDSGGDRLPVTDFNSSILSKQIQNRVDQDDYHGMLILPVMIPGGFYSEDREIRIRSRFAIGSALGQSGYAPQDAERIGSVTLWWPTRNRIRDLAKALNDKAKELNDKATKISLENLAEMWPGPPHKKTWPSPDLRYEWYRPRVSSPRGTNDPYSDILVLWLNERYFEDEPLLRLPMLLAPIRNAVQKRDKPRRVVLIGPYWSSTLRAMLPDWDTGEVRLKKDYSDLWPHIQKILGKIEVYSATATAMDATLLKNGPDDAKPRGSVAKVLEDKKTIGFKSFQNFVATDDQLAEEMLDELKLRGVDFADKANHLVLISEWDTFYAQVLSLTYKASLAKRQDTVKSRAAFVKQYMPNPIPEEPKNLDSFVYLRGIDGQTAGPDLEATRGPGSEEGTPARPTLLADLRKWISDASKVDLGKWTPDANKAEGRAQFDYLSRLGEHLATLEEQLSKRDEHIKAIGVVGSDVYDTLLILQALRYRVPNALFFTMGLDARLWHPRELSWSRNLLVTSSYGLTLDPKLQQSVPPFRDSFQTAQFTAALAALGHSELSELPRIPPRRFEIGKRGPVDLSVRPSPLSVTSDPERAFHPVRVQGIQPTRRTYVGVGIVILVAGLSLTFFCGPLRRLTWESSQFQTDTLRYREEDVGGTEGAWTLARGLRESANKPDESLGKWLSEEFKRLKLDASRQRLSADTEQHEAKSAGGPLRHDYTVLLNRIDEALARIDASATAASGRSTQIVALEDSGVQGLRGHAERPHVVLAVIGTEATPQSLDRNMAHAARKEIEDCKEALLRGWLDFLNRVLHRKSRHPGDAVEHTTLLHENLKVEWECWWPIQEGLDPERPEAPQRPEAPKRLRQGRAILDALLQKLGEQAPKAGASLEPDEQEDILKKAHAAREASLQLYVLRRRWACQFWIVILAMIAWAIGLGVAIWSDTFFTLEGELFSLTSGTSAWPGEILRFAAFALAIGLGFQAYQSLRTMMYELTRRFRLPLVSNPHLPWLYRPGRLPASPAAGGVVQVSELWQDYQQYVSFGRRMGRIVWTLGLYMMFSVGLALLTQSDMLRPLRGSSVRHWDGIILLGAILSFLFLTFMTIDAARV